MTNGMTNGMTPVTYPAEARTVFYGNRCYVTGWLAQNDKNQTIVTDIWNGNQTVIHNSRVREVRAAR